MISICFYFQVHQPYRINEFTFFNIGKNKSYINDALNEEIINKVSQSCYLPANELMINLSLKYPNKFKIAYSFSGIAIEQMEKYAPDTLASFKTLMLNPNIEILGETYYHSLSSIYIPEEFERQAKLHSKKVKEIFKQTPTTFRNTELIYSNNTAPLVHNIGFNTIITESVGRILKGKNENRIYNDSNKHTNLMLRNYNLSDDIGFRFSDKNSKEYPLTAKKFIHKLSKIKDAECINICLDYETFGEHHKKENKIFGFLENTLEEIMNSTDFELATPKVVTSLYKPTDVYDVKEYISWADTERDLSAWLGNSMQHEAMKKIYELREKVFAKNNKELIDLWAKLTTSDHFYYMSTKTNSDGMVHKYFSPYNTPYDAYVYYMNIISDFEIKLKNI
ncbi:MAG: glycoside hydrolase family 57 protein [Cytophagales bacterium]|nr:glycoside hydrolase family 57 protein [Cytophagales bacterium]